MRALHVADNGDALRTPVPNLEELVMTVNDSGGRNPRRSTFLNSVAALGLAAVIAGGAVGYQETHALAAPAQAVAAVQPAGFADLVAKVKPAVIAVRVAMEDSAQTTSSK